MDEKVLEAYRFFEIDTNVVLESAMDTIKEKVSNFIKKVKEYIQRFMTWLKTVIKPKIDKLISKLNTDTYINKTLLNKTFEILDVVLKYTEDVNKVISTGLDTTGEENISDFIDGSKKISTEAQDIVSGIDALISRDDWHKGDRIKVTESIKQQLKQLYKILDEVLIDFKKSFMNFNAYANKSEFLPTEDSVKIQASLTCVTSQMMMVTASQKLCTHLLSNAISQEA